MRLPLAPWKVTSVVAAGHGLAAAAFEFGFVVEGIEVGDAAGAEDLDDPFRLWGQSGVGGRRRKAVRRRRWRRRPVESRGGGGRGC
jgi:hypothetical protein